MENGWYYACNDKKLGPFTPRQLKDLADSGTILRSDTIWKAGVEKGVQADRVKNLFAAIAPVAPVLPSIDDVEVPRLVPLVPFVGMEESKALAQPEPSTAVAAPAPPTAPKARPATKGRATALAGAIIVSQDGERARFRMVCKTCGHQDSACQTILITNKTFKRNFFCPKCRRRRDVSIQCQTR